MEKSFTNEEIERFHSRGQQLCKFIGTKESAYIRKEFNSLRTRLEHQHGFLFIVLEHQYGLRDVMWKRSIEADPYKCLPGILPLLDCTGKESPLQDTHRTFSEEICIKALGFHELRYI